jgi:hypothetical protein
MKKFVALLMLGLLFLATFRLILAAPEEFSLAWWTVDGGGASSQGGGYAVRGTIGQPDASGAMQGGVYAMRGGFWHKDIVLAGGSKVFLPLVMR